MELQEFLIVQRIIDLSGNFEYIKSMKNKTKQFIQNPLSFILACLGYQFAKPSPLLTHMVEFTHSSWVEDLCNQNRIRDYKYNLFSYEDVR